MNPIIIRNLDLDLHLHPSQRTGTTWHDFFFAQVVLPWREISNHLGELAQLQPERDKGGYCG